MKPKNEISSLKQDYYNSDNRDLHVHVNFTIRFFKIDKNKTLSHKIAITV